MNHAKQIHAHALRCGAHHETHLVLDLLLRIPNLQYAHRLLDSLVNPPSTFLYNKLLRAYSVSSVNYQVCLSIFSSMLRNRSVHRPNLHSFTFLITACANSCRPCHGRSLHALFFKYGFPFDAFVSTALLQMYFKAGLLPAARQLFEEISHRDVAIWNSMITGYARSGGLDSAKEIFELMPTRNVISWTSMISAYSQNEKHEKAIQMFLRMWETRQARPNEVTLTSVLPSCAHLGAIELGEKIEAYARDNELVANVFVGSALVDMYAKCGDVERAMVVFRQVETRGNICTWNSMIMGLALHGRWKESLELFHEMREKGITPDGITFTAVLMACTHGGLVKEGKWFFESMEKDHSISPKLQHYGCMVDLLGRAGLLIEAYDLIKRMPMGADAVVWGALLGACSFHGNVEFAEIAAESLFKLEPWNPGNHVILANIYSCAGMWDSVAGVWKKIKIKQQKKVAGCSFVELGGKMHKFLVEDESHPSSKEIYILLDQIYTMMYLTDDDLHSNLQDALLV